MPARKVVRYHWARPRLRSRQRTACSGYVAGCPPLPSRKNKQIEARSDGPSSYSVSPVSFTDKVVYMVASCRQEMLTALFLLEQEIRDGPGAERH